MTDREKLSELVCESTNHDCGKHCNLSSASKCYSCTSVADYLLENGVTFAKDMDVPSKWISVKDRLPECDCLAYSSKSGLMTVGYIEPHWLNGGTEYICANGLELLFNVTHWMPLPEAPKEE